MRAGGRASCQDVVNARKRWDENLLVHVMRLTTYYDVGSTSENLI